jgi:uncharacterized phage protein (TIGR01671 family)
MRELKFRAWDKNHKVFIIHSDIHVFIQDFENNTIFKMNHADNYNNKDRDYNNDRIIIQQYIGLKDINENDIYEGDILDKRQKLVIEFYNGSFGYWISGAFISIYHVSDLICRLKVIGNIYENSGLLENHT